MDHYFAAGIYAQPTGAFAILRAGIRDPQRQMELAVRVLEIDGVGAFRGLVVALPALGPGRAESQSDVVFPDQLVVIVKTHDVFVLQNNDAVNGFGPKRIPRRSRSEDGQAGQEGDEKWAAHCGCGYVSKSGVNGN